MKTLLLLLALFVPSTLYAQPPDHSSVVFQVAAGRNLSTEDAQHKFVDDVVCALNRVDPNWGHLRKNPGQTQVHGHAEDAALYRPLGQVVDFIGGARTPNARPTWNVDIPRYRESDWLPPHNCSGEVVPPPGPTPQPPLPTPVVDLAPIMERLDRLDRALSELSQQLSSVGTTVRQAVDTIIEVRDRPIPAAPTYTGKVLGFPITLRPNTP